MKVVHSKGMVQFSTVQSCADPGNFIRGGGGSYIVWPLQNPYQGESVKVLPLQNPYWLFRTHNRYGTVHYSTEQYHTVQCTSVQVQYSTIKYYS